MKLIGNVLKVPVKDDDVFRVSWIRNADLNALRKLNTIDIPANFVYQDPSVSALGKFTHDLTLADAS